MYGQHFFVCPHHFHNAEVLLKDDVERKPGPDPNHLKLDGDWEDRLKEALEKKRLKEGWPDPEDSPEEPETGEE